MTIHLYSHPPGGLGNRLFCYNFIRQLAYACGIPYAHPWLKDSKYFESMGLRLRPRWFGKKLVIDSEFLKSLSPDQLRNLITNSVDMNFLLKPPFLGETFYDYSLVAPLNFIRLREPFLRNPGWRRDNQVVIGVHFRGGDFFNWNPAAVLDAKYYVNAIKLALRDSGGRRTGVALFADDTTLESYRIVQAQFSGLCIDMSTGNQATSSEITDFHNLSVCDYIVSSPSTFCIWAGILGEGTKIIHSEEWIESQVHENSKFWQQLWSGGSNYYRLWAVT